VRELLPEEKEALGPEGEKATHVARFFDFEAYRQIIGTIREEDDEHLVFDMGEGKSYEFREFRG
ncbi:MAG: hypothetical protein DRI93_05480, partial [Aquificota bacterium]